MEYCAPFSGEKVHFCSIPATAGEVVVRPRLLRILDRAADLTVVHALRGSGKTTLVANWANSQSCAGVRVYWINMADTPEALLGLMVAEFENTAGGVLVLEDFHLLADEALIDSICALARSNPSLRLVAMATDWGKLRTAARQQGLSVQEIRGAALLADEAELSAMGTAWGHEMSSSRTAKLLRLTGGWLQPARLLLDAGCDRDLDHGPALRFLSQHVAPGIDHTRALEVASRLASASAITTHHVEASVQSLHHRNPDEGHDAKDPLPFISLEETGLLRRNQDTAGATTWSLPELVRDVLAEDFHTYHSTVARSWHGRMAAVMFADGRGADQAMILHHARKGEAWSVLAGMWNRHALMLTVSQPREAQAAYMDLPGVALEAEPILVLAGSAVTAAAKFDGSPSSFAAGHRALMQAFRTIGRPTGKAAQTGISLADQACMTAAGMIAHRSRGRFAEAKKLADSFAKRGAGVPAARGASECSGTTAWFRHQSAITVLLSGDVAGSRDLFSAAYDCATGPNEGFIAADAAANMALACTLTGMPDTAREWLDTAGEKSISNGWVRYLVGLPGFIARALMATDALEVDAAAVELAKAGDGTNHMELWPFIVLAATELALLRGETAMMGVELGKAVALNAPTHSRGSAAEQVIARCRADLLLAQGELNQASRVLDDASECLGWLEVPRARLQLLAGNHNRAFRLADAGLWRKEISPRDRIELLLIKAAAAEHRGEIVAAGNAFAQAVELAGASGQLRPFRGLSPAILLVLADRASVALPAAAQMKVLAGPPIYPVAAVMVDLTKRELTVLYEMVRHGTAADIAKKLVVSPNTVKKQLGSLYNKLGVNDRQSALDRARRLAFLPEPG